MWDFMPVGFYAWKLTPNQASVTLTQVMGYRRPAVPLCQTHLEGRCVRKCKGVFLCVAMETPVMLGGVAL